MSRDTRGSTNIRHLREGHQGHGTKPLDQTRAVRGTSLVSEEILALFTTSGLPVTVTIDVESSALERVTAEEITALRANLNTLDFTDWHIELSPC